MGDYTISIRQIIRMDNADRKTVESWFCNYNINEFLKPEEIIVLNESGWKKERLAEKIIDHYYMREIGFETIPLFQHFVKVHMQEIMEEKLPILYSKFIKYDPMVNIKINQTSSRTGTGNTENKTNTEGKTTNNDSGLNVHNDTPQGQISKTKILQGDYATDVTANEGTSTNEGTSSATSNSNAKNEENAKSETSGYTGILGSELIQAFRNIQRGVDQEIIESCNKLFMGIW